VASRFRNHIILCGLGSVGYEVAKDLQRQRIPFVVVDATPEDIHARDVASRVPLIIGDATDPETLLRAGFDRARAVVATISNDAVNLEVGLLAQSLAEERRPHRSLRVVLRCFDGDLARRIHDRSDAYTLLSSAEIAAPIFVNEALGV
jgi:voltage-gated potassium channel Kch